MSEELTQDQAARCYVDRALKTAGLDREQVPKGMAIEAWYSILLSLEQAFKDGVKIGIRVGLQMERPDPGADEPHDSKEG